MSIRGFGSGAARMSSQPQVLPVAFAALVANGSLPAGAADSKRVERGKYLVTIASCTDCHTPGHLLGKAGITRQLSGSDALSR
jgi:mono/diheme cytochrome c family protein